MSMIAFLEELANNVHHQNDELLRKQSNEIQQAFITNDSNHLKKQIGNTENLPDTCMVVFYN